MSDAIVKVGVRVLFPVASLCAAVEVALRKNLGTKQSRRLARLGEVLSVTKIIIIKRESLGLCRFGEAWAALRAENLLTYFTPPQHSVSTTHSTYLKRSLLTEGTWSLEQTLGHDVPTTREELVPLGSTG